MKHAKLWTRSYGLIEESIKALSDIYVREWTYHNIVDVVENLQNTEKNIINV